MKRLRFLVSILFAFLVVPSFALATTERTNSLDLNTLDLTINQDNSDEGWSWDASVKTLTLTDINFNVDNDYGIKLPSDLDIEINLVGENKIVAEKPLYRFDTFDNETVTISGTGSLEIISTNELSAIDLVNLIIESGEIKVSGGTINILKTLEITGGILDVDTSNVSDTGFKNGIVADGSIEISDGKVNINAKEYGIVVKGTNEINPLIGVNITGGEISINATTSAVYAGDSSVNPSVQKDVVIDGAKIDFKDSPIGIYSAEGNIDIYNSYIEYLDETEVYKFDSLNSISVATIGYADYSELDDLLDSITSNLSIYSTSSIEYLKNVVNSIDYSKNTLEQKQVNKYVSDVTYALNNLVLKGADYSKIDELINSVDLSKYTDETVNRFNDFVNSIDRNINILNQSMVDEYVDDLNNIINCLITKPIENVDGITNNTSTNITVPSYNNYYNSNYYNESSNNETNNEIENTNDDIDNEDKSEIKDDEKDKSEIKDDTKKDTDNKKSNKILLIVLWIVLGLFGLLILAFIVLLIIKKIYTAKRKKETMNKSTSVLKNTTTVTKPVVKKEIQKKTTKVTTTKTTNSSKKKTNNTTKKKMANSKTTTKKK